MALTFRVETPCIYISAIASFNALSLLNPFSKTDGVNEISPLTCGTFKLSFPILELTVLPLKPFA